MYMNFSLIFLFVLRCIKLTTFEKEDEYINQIVREIGELSINPENKSILEKFHDKSVMTLFVFKGKSDSFCVPISSSTKEDVKVVNEEASSSISLSKHKYNNLFIKSVIESLTGSKIFIFPGLVKIENLKKYVIKYEEAIFRDKRSSSLRTSSILTFISEYTRKIDSLIRNSESDIYFIRHAISDEIMKMNMKSLFKETEVNESVSSVKAQNELRTKNVDFSQFMMFLVYKSQANDLQDQEIEFFNLVSDISEEFVQNTFPNVVDQCFSSFLSRFSEPNQQVDELRNLILSFFAQNFIKMHKKSKNIFETIKYIFEGCFYKFWSFFVRNREEFQNFLNSPEEVLKSYLFNFKQPDFYINIDFGNKSVSLLASKLEPEMIFLIQIIKLVPRTFFSKVHAILEDIYSDFIRDEPAKTCKQKKIIAANNLRKMFGEELLSKKENMCCLLSKVAGFYLSSVEANDLEIREEFGKILSQFLSENWSFCQYLINNPNCLVIMLFQIILRFYSK